MRFGYVFVTVVFAMAFHMGWGLRAARGEGDELGNVPSCLGGLPGLVPPGRSVAPGGMLGQETDPGLMLGIASLDLDMNFENSGKQRQIKSAVYYQAYNVRARVLEEVRALVKVGRRDVLGGEASLDAAWPSGMSPATHRQAYRDQFVCGSLRGEEKCSVFLV